MASQYVAESLNKLVASKQQTESPEARTIDSSDETQEILKKASKQLGHLQSYSAHHLVHSLQSRIGAHIALLDRIKSDMTSVAERIASLQSQISSNYPKQYSDAVQTIDSHPTTDNDDT